MTSLENYSSDPSSGLDIIRELEHAIKNSYLDEFEEFVRESSTTKANNPLPSKILDIENEEKLIAELANLNSADEIEQMLKIEEQVYSATFKNLQREEVLDMLLKQNIKRIVNLVMVLRKQVFNVSDIQSENMEMISSYKERIKGLHSKYNTLQTNYSDLKIELEDKNDLYNKLVEKNKEMFQQLQMYKGNEKILKQMRIEQLNDMEEDSQKLARALSRIKTEKISNLLSDLENAKKATEDAKKCIICNEKNTCILLKPCNHANVCEDCVLRITHCPIDRSEILSQERIYL